MSLKRFLLRILKGKKLSVDDVFTPGGVPSVTYVRREHLGLELQLEQALNRKFSFIVVSGPTKCGKSVLCRKVLGTQTSINVEGGQVSDAQGFWRHVAHQLKIPTSHTATRSQSWAVEGSMEATAGIPAVLQKRLSGKATGGGQDGLSATFDNVLVLEAIKKLMKRRMALVIDDFHYLNAETQRQIIRALKSSILDGLKVVVLAVPHRAFDIIDGEVEAEGRANHIEIPSWSPDDLIMITDTGFRALSLNVPRNIQRRICEDGFGNPLLVQEICHELSEARLAASAANVPVSASDLISVYNRLAEAKGLNRYEQLTQAPAGDVGPQMVKLREGGEEDLHMVILSAIARLGPQPLTTYVELREAITALTGDPPPQRARVVTALTTITTMLKKGGAAPFEWLASRDTLAISDPFLMFYLRWVLRDKRKLTLSSSAIDIAVRVQPRLHPNSEGGDVR